MVSGMFTDTGNANILPVSWMWLAVLNIGCMDRGSGMYKNGKN